MSRTLRILIALPCFYHLFSLLFSLCFTAYCSNFSEVTTEAPADDVTAVPNESTASRLKGVLDISCSYLSSRTSCFGHDYSNCGIEKKKDVEKLVSENL